jgi:hypothetical protein
LITFTFDDCLCLSTLVGSSQVKSGYSRLDYFQLRIRFFTPWCPVSDTPSYGVVQSQLRQVYRVVQFQLHQIYRVVQFHIRQYLTTLLHLLTFHRLKNRRNTNFVDSYTFIKINSNKLDFINFINFILIVVETNVRNQPMMIADRLSENPNPNTR